MGQLLSAASDVDKSVSPAELQLSVSSWNHALSSMRAVSTYSLETGRYGKSN